MSGTDGQESGTEGGSANSSGRTLKTDLINARYKPIRALGEGGKGQVILAEHILLGTLVALKVLHPENSRSHKDLERLRQEASICAGLEHENLVRVLDLGTMDDGSAFIVLDYVEGRSLKDVLSDKKKLDQSGIVEILMQTCRGLQFLHEHNIVHRDVKPENILVTPDGRVKIIDLGVAKPENQDGAVQALTRTGNLVGSPYYMSPEQCGGDKGVDSRSDVYSLGCIIFECVNGHPPFRGSTTLRTLDMHINDVPSQEGADEKSIEGRLLQIGLKCLKKNPDERYQSAKEVLQELSRLNPASKPSAVVSKRGIRPLSAIVVALIIAAICYNVGRHMQGTDVPDKILLTRNDFTRAFFLSSKPVFLQYKCDENEIRRCYEDALNISDLPEPMYCSLAAEYCHRMVMRGSRGWKKRVDSVFRRIEPRLEHLAATDTSVYKDVGIGTSPMLYLAGAEAVFNPSDFKLALRRINRGISLAKKYPESSWTLPHLGLARGLIYDMQGKHDAAIQELELRIVEFDRIYGKGGNTVVELSPYGTITPTIIVSAFAVLQHAYRMKGDEVNMNRVNDEVERRLNTFHTPGMPVFATHSEKIRDGLIRTFAEPHASPFDSEPN